MVDRCKNIKLTLPLCERATLFALDGKWKRTTTLELMNKYGGVTNAEIKAKAKVQDMTSRLEAVKGIACEVLQRLEDLQEGYAEDLDLEPVKKEKWQAWKT